MNMDKHDFKLPESIVWHFSTVLRVRISDINFAGHLAHDRVVSLLHEARARLFQSHDWTELNVAGASIIVADLHVRYLHEAFFGEELRIDIAIINLRNRSCDIIYRVSRPADGITLVEASTGVVFFDYTTRKSTAIPDVFRACFTD